MTDSNKRGDPKEKADVPPVLPREQPTASDSGGALTPEELDFTDSPHVAEVSDGRYVVSADHSPPAVSERDDSGAASESPEAPTAATTRESSSQSSDAARSRTPEPEPRPDQQRIRSPETARSVLADELERSDARYAIDIVSRFRETTVRHRTTSDDVVGTFDGLVLWYAQNVAPDTSTQRTASLLFERSEFTAPLSQEQVRRAARKHGLDRSSSIGELLDAIE